MIHCYNVFIVHQSSHYLFIQIFNFLFSFSRTSFVMYMYFIHQIQKMKEILYDFSSFLLCNASMYANNYCIQLCNICIPAICLGELVTSLSSQLCIQCNIPRACIEVNGDMSGCKLGFILSVSQCSLAIKYISTLKLCFLHLL